MINSSSGVLHIADDLSIMLGSFWAIQPIHEIFEHYSATISHLKKKHKKNDIITISSLSYCTLDTHTFTFSHARVFYNAYNKHIISPFPGIHHLSYGIPICNVPCFFFGHMYKLCIQKSVRE